MADAGYAGSGVQPIGAGTQDSSALDSLISAINSKTAAEALQKSLNKSATEWADNHVKTVGPHEAAKTLVSLTGAAGSAGATSDTSSDAPPMSYNTSDGNPPALTTPNPTTQSSGSVLGNLVGAKEDATDTTTPAIGRQSTQIQANNEQIRQDAYDTLHPTSWFGKILSFIPGVGQSYQTIQLKNLNSALQIGGGDPQGEYYKAYSGTLKQIMTGDKPIDSQQLAELTAGQRNAGLKAISDGQQALNDALKGTVQTIDIMSKNKSLPENIGAMGGATDRMKEGYKTAQGILERLQNLNEVTKGLAANPIQFNKKGAVIPEADTKTNFNSIEDAKAAGVAPGTVVTIGGKKYKAQ